MERFEELLQGLRDANDEFAYSCLKELEALSMESKKVYEKFELLVKLMEDPKSYIRTRGIRLIAANAKWDQEGKIDRIVKPLLSHITDGKPVTARQCIQALPLIAMHKPALREGILNSLKDADLGKYKESMQTLLARDIQDAVEAIHRLEEDQNV